MNFARPEQDHKPTVQQIPVGQSIDSADYAAFEASKQVAKPKDRRTEGGAPPNEGDTRESHLNDRVETVTSADEQSTAKNNENAPQVEEAVIKIQAYVRGHLTRKALKDAQQHNATPLPNALGQSQFDEESLLKNRKY